MPTLRYLHLDVFTDRALEGNQLAVLPEPQGLTADAMQAIAREMAFSESMFIFPPERGGVVRMVLREVLVLSAVGLAIGMATALVTSKFVASFLYGMKPNDPLALTLSVITLLGAALLAGYVPARKASRIDPMAALRHE